MAKVVSGIFRENACEVFAAVLKGPKTKEEIGQMTGICERSMTYWIKAMRNSGLIYRAGRVPAKKGEGSLLWAAQPSPFHHEDKV